MEPEPAPIVVCSSIPTISIKTLNRIKIGRGCRCILVGFYNQQASAYSIMSNSSDVSTFQGLIFALQQYWADQGCAILQPYDMEMGAGTFHTATFLRSIGPEPWNAAYVQPSRRPTDGRYGENPNRLQHYYQYQVILKPSPPDSQEVYLESLSYLGIDPLKHDIRFVEDENRTRLIENGLLLFKPLRFGRPEFGLDRHLKITG